jgi:Presenilin
VRMLARMESPFSGVSRSVHSAQSASRWTCTCSTLPPPLSHCDCNCRRTFNICSMHPCATSAQALTKWEMPTDIFTFVFSVWNFAVVGVVAVFYQKGIPTLVTQAYLVRCCWYTSYTMGTC